MNAPSQPQTIRQPAVAGQFYPADKNELSQMIDGFLSAAHPPAIVGQPKILIVPHAGYVFSGQTAAYGFKTLVNYDYDTVIILGSSHNYPVFGLALYGGDAKPIEKIIKEKERQMKSTAKDLEFELAAILWDEINELGKINRERNPASD